MKDSKKKLIDELALKKAEYFSLQGKYNDLKDKYDNLKEHAEYLEKYCNSLSGHYNCYRSKFESNYQEYIKQMEDKITSLIKQRDNWKADCEYNEQCFQAEREARYKLEDEIKVIKGQKTYPCISLNCNDITGESSSLYFCFSYDDRVLLANNVPKYINKSMFEIYISVDRLGLTYYISCPSYFDEKGKPYIYFKVLHDTKQLIDYDRPLDWMNYCNNKSNKDIKDNYFQRYCFLGVNNRLYVCVSKNKYIMLDMQPESWIQKSDKWKILYDSNTRNGLVQIYDSMSVKAVTYYIENDRKSNKVIGELL